MVTPRFARIGTAALLALVLTLAVGIESHAAPRPVHKGSPTTKTSHPPKPSTVPLIGEPDTGHGSPLPPKTGWFPTGSDNSPFGDRFVSILELWWRRLTR